MIGVSVLLWGGADFYPPISHVAIGIMRRPMFFLVILAAWKKRMHILFCIGKITRLRTHGAFGHEDSRWVMLMDVREGEGLPGVPALNFRGERSARCTSALTPTVRRITSSQFRVSFFA